MSLEVANGKRQKHTPIPCCPICGGALSEEATWDPNTRTFAANGNAVRLTRREATILNPIWLARHRGGVVGRERLADLAFADEIDGGPLTYEALSVCLAKLRAKLAVTGVTITRGYGTSASPFQLVNIKKTQEAAS